MNTPLIALVGVAACAGLATASQSTPTNTPQLQESAPAGPFATLTIDLSGVESWDWFNDPDNYYASYNLMPDAHIVGVGWDLTIETAGASWMSEVFIDIRNTNSTGGVSLNPGFNAAYPGIESFSSDGIISIVGNGDFFLNNNGMLHLTVYEGWDDNDDAVDATFLAGSVLYVQYVVPAPATLTMLGLGGFMATRRRR